MPKTTTRNAVARADDHADGHLKRPKNRRELILEAALELFGERGFAATGIDEIGEAAGISGPAVYRHFQSKNEILLEALNRIGRRLRRGVDEAAALPPDEALAHLVATHVDTVIEQGSFVVVWLRERNALKEEHRFSMRRYQRMQIEEWVHVLTHQRSELSDTEARAVVNATLSLIHSAALFRSELAPERMRKFLIDAAMGVLMSPVPQS